MVPKPGTRGHGKERTSVLKGFEFSGRTLLPILALTTLVWAGCGGTQDSADQDVLPAAARPMSPEVQELVNQGNEAHRAGSYEEAGIFFQEAMDLDPEHPVPQFGALMAAMAAGDNELAESLSQRLQETSPELLAMLSPDGSMGGGMPPDGMTGNPHADGEMPGGMPSGMPAMPPMEGATPIEGLPQGHPTLYDVGPADTIQPDTSGGR